MRAVSIPTVYSWIKRWRKGGVEELATDPPKRMKHNRRWSLKSVRKSRKNWDSVLRCGRIERFWRHLKNQACANKTQDTIEAVIDSAEQVLIEQNRAEQVSVFHFLKNL